MTEATVTPISPPPPPPKAGWRTSEFWLHLAAQVVGALAAANVFPAGGRAAQIAGMALMLLSALGYSYNRTQLKAGQ